MFARPRGLRIRLNVDDRFAKPTIDFCRDLIRIFSIFSLIFKKQNILDRDFYLLTLQVVLLRILAQDKFLFVDAHTRLLHVTKLPSYPLSFSNCTFLIRKSRLLGIDYERREEDCKCRE